MIVQSHEDLKKHLSLLSDVKTCESVSREELETIYYLSQSDGSRTLVGVWWGDAISQRFEVYQPGEVVNTGNGWQSPA